MGRPNVGKSTLFNKIIGHRISIVEDTPGVTRDRIVADAEWVGKEFQLIDTGGIETKTEDLILSKMKDQAQIAIDMADVILFIVDGKSGITPMDREIAIMLRKTKKPVVLVVNKLDHIKHEENKYEFYELGFDTLCAISSSQGLGIGDMLDDVVSFFPAQTALSEEDQPIKVAIVGRPNAGKSSILNRMLGEERVIVTPIAGTTRDAIDTDIVIEGQRYIFIDTAGIRRKSRVHENIERYSVLRSEQAMDRSDVVLHVIDASARVTEQDSKIIGIAHELGKPMVIVVNKWDLLEKDNQTMKQFEAEIYDEFPFVRYVPIIYISALTGQRFTQITDQIQRVHAESQKRISTGILNDVIGEAVLMNQPPSDKGKRLKIFYVTQNGIQPPTFQFFINDKDLFHFSYQRYLENKIRENFGFEGNPLRFITREKKGQ